jgi:hypothetical protein
MMSTLGCLRLEGYRGTRCEILSSLIRHPVPPPGHAAYLVNHIVFVFLQEVLSSRH